MGTHIPSRREEVFLSLSAGREPVTPSGFTNDNLLEPEQVRPGCSTRAANQWHLNINSQLSKTEANRAISFPEINFPETSEQVKVNTIEEY